MKRSVQEIIELLVFGLIALLIGTGLLWLVGWIFGGIGYLLTLLAGLIWSLLRFVVPIAVVGAAVYALVRLLQGQRSEKSKTASAPTNRSSSTTAPAPPPTTSATSETRAGSSAEHHKASPPPAEATTIEVVEAPSQRAAVVEEEIPDGTKEPADRDRVAADAAVIETEVETEADTEVDVETPTERKPKREPETYGEAYEFTPGEPDEESGDTLAEEPERESPERDSDEDEEERR